MRDIVDANTRTVGGAGEDPSVVLAGRKVEAWRQRLVNITLIFADVVLALVIWEIAVLLRILWAPIALPGLAVVSIVPIVVVWVVIRATQGLYPGYGMDEAEELRRQTYALMAMLAFTTIFAFAFQIGTSFSRFLVGVVFVGLLFLAPLMRHFVKRWMARNGVWGKPIVIMGAGQTGSSLRELLIREWRLGYRPVATFDARPDVAPETELAARRIERVPNRDVLAEAVELCRGHRVDTIFFAMPRAPREYLAGLTSLAGLEFRNVVIVPDLAGVTNSAVTARNFAGTLGVEIRHNLLNPSVRRAKRALDVVMTVLGGIVISPLLILLMLLVWTESRGGAIFYKAPRMGRDGQLFSCVKFRTMVPDAEETLAKLLAEDPKAREEYGKYHKLRDDPRVTRVGRFLRKTSLDELPQIFNVLRGDMSLVGPRPYLPRESAEIGVSQGEILRVYPGITGPWQVGGRNDTSFAERVEIDAYYVRDWSIWLDMVILARTLRYVLLRRGGY